jgi:solute carrier family 35 (UDP-galactose transporter), member B1
MAIESKTTSPSPSSSFLHLIFCAAGIYGFFLTWGILQERITTMEYMSMNSNIKSRFSYFQVLNMIQSGFAALLAFLQILVQRLPICGTRENPHRPTSILLFSFFKIAVCSSVASSLGYRSLRHLNYPTMILGKSCKLVPVMLMNFLIYRKKFEAYKYATVALITIGVSGFMLFESKSGSGKAAGAAGNSLWGLGLLLSNLLMDGATNSWQDQLFIKYRLKSQQLMMFMNLFSGLILAISLVFYTFWQPEKSQLLAAIQFFKQFPSALPDVFAFSLCGALGQLFIFHTLEHFGSLSLVTITVTRKLFTILLSLFWFNHQVNTKQWTCVSLVFLALILESFIGKFMKKSQVKKEEEEKKIVTETVEEKFILIKQNEMKPSKRTEGIRKRK